MQREREGEYSIFISPRHRYIYIPFSLKVKYYLFIFFFFFYISKRSEFYTAFYTYFHYLKFREASETTSLSTFISSVIFLFRDLFSRPAFLRKKMITSFFITSASVLLLTQCNFREVFQESTFLLAGYSFFSAISLFSVSFMRKRKKDKDKHTPPP